MVLKKNRKRGYIMANVKELELVGQGRVCDIYRILGDPNLLLLNRSDRFYLGEQRFPGEIPNKGIILNQMSIKWFDLLQKEGIKNHIITTDPKRMILLGATTDMIGSCMVVENYKVLPIISVVRGYVTDSPSWELYINGQTPREMFGNTLPAGLKNGDKLTKPIYTPKVKMADGKTRCITFKESLEVIQDFLKDILVSEKHMSDEELYLTEDKIEYISEDIAYDIQEISLRAYNFAYKYALERGIIIADAKLEFGLHFDVKSGIFEVVLVDEIFTPDSARFWDMSAYETGSIQEIDKNSIKEIYSFNLGWNEGSNPPELPENLLREAGDIYTDIYQQLFKENALAMFNRIMYEWSEAEKLVSGMLEESTQKEIAGYLNNPN